jgi:two-component system sensor histidine kinase KdpD
VDRTAEHRLDRDSVGDQNLLVMTTLATKSDGPSQAMSARPRQFAAALLMVGASTVVGLLTATQWGVAPIVLLYVPAVLGAAIHSGRWPALVAAVASTLAYNFFFTAPHRTFLVHSTADLVTVAVLFVVALVTNHLAGSMREQARLAAAHAMRNETIAGLSRHLLSCTSERDIADVVVRELSALFHCNVVFLVGGDDAQLLSSAPFGLAMAPGDTAAATITLNSGGPAGRGIDYVSLSDWQFHPIAANETVMAAVGLARDDGRQPAREDRLPLLGSLLDQVALALERARLEQQARAYAALHERDRLRAALLASIGEDLKPRLNAIAAASRALRRNGTGDKATLETVGSEVAKLDRYIDNLVDLSPGSDQSPIELGAVAIDLYRRSVFRDGEEVHLTPKEYAVLAELAKHAGRVLSHAHLLRAVWGPAQQNHVDYLRVAVRSLRQKLERDPARPQLIINQPAVGYRLATS